MAEYINLVGNPIDGFRVFGIYNNHQEASNAQEGIDQDVYAMEIEFADHFSVCTECDKHTNDARLETKWSEDADPYCKECFEKKTSPPRRASYLNNLPRLIEEIKDRTERRAEGDEGGTIAPKTHSEKMQDNLEPIEDEGDKDE